VEKHGKARQARDQDGIRCMSFACWVTEATNTHSCVLHNCFSTATIVMRMRPNITLYVNCLSCSKYKGEIFHFAISQKDVLHLNRYTSKILFKLYRKWSKKCVVHQSVSRRLIYTRPYMHFKNDNFSWIQTKHLRDSIKRLTSPEFPTIIPESFKFRIL
jgi:hypothetical protein